MRTNQNKKIWFYTEGFSEVEFVKRLFFRYFSQIKKCQSEIEFLQETENSAIYIHNSRDVNKIPYDINDFNHWIERSNPDAVIIICDLEKIPCPTERKNSMIAQIDNDSYLKKPPIHIEKNKLLFVFSLPNIEEIYCSEIKITKNILNETYRRSHGNKITFNDDEVENILTTTSMKPLEKIKKIFKKFGLTYKKREFSESFFSQLDYENSKNKSVKRLFLAIKKTLQER
jgi:hypothetical protein